jgi:hypothetical protein
VSGGIHRFSGKLQCAPHSSRAQYSWNSCTGEQPCQVHCTKTARDASHLHIMIKGEQLQMLNTSSVHAYSCWRHIGRYNLMVNSSCRAHLAAEVRRGHVQDERCELVPLDCVVGVRIRCCTAHAVQVTLVHTMPNCSHQSSSSRSCAALLPSPSMNFCTIASVRSTFLLRNAAATSFAVKCPGEGLCACLHTYQLRTTVCLVYCNAVCTHRPDPCRTN